MRTMKKKRKIIIILIIVLAAAYIAFINFLLSAALIPSFMNRLKFVERITEQSYDEQVQSETIDRRFDESIDNTQKWYKEVESTVLNHESADGYKLVATEFYSEDKSTHHWLLLLHGFTARKEEMYPLAMIFQQNGYNVIVPDMRCQGESEGDFIGMGYTDSDDNMLWIEEILSQDPDAEIVLFGQSMGASCALMMSGRDDLSDHVKAVISDSAYTDAYSIFSDRLQAWFHLPPALVMPAANTFLQIRGGYDLKDASALEAVQRSSVPTLFIHGLEDQFIPSYMTEELYEAENAKKELLIVPGAGHVQSVDVDPKEYWGTVWRFLSEKIS